jgi:hypothetical protein
MDQVVDFLSKNKDWLFSGIGTVLITGFFSLLSGFFCYKKGFADGRSVRVDSKGDGCHIQAAGGDIKNS